LLRLRRFLPKKKQAGIISAIPIDTEDAVHTCGNSSEIVLSDSLPSSTYQDIKSKDR
jgi:hypothetical protein